jgi:hypothetical protein
MHRDRYRREARSSREKKDTRQGARGKEATSTSRSEEKGRKQEVRLAWLGLGWRQSPGFSISLAVALALFIFTI